MFDQLETKSLPAADDSARTALHEEAMRTSKIAPESLSTSTDGKIQPVSVLEAQAKVTVALSANDLRKAEESKFFRDMYQKSNFELDPMTKGESPLQSLEQMSREGKIKLSDEQMQAEAKRIQERDSNELGRNFYVPTDHIKMWTGQEIDQKVNDMVDKVKGIDVSNWQKNIDWKQVKDAGYQFAFMKATEGVDFVDPYLESYRKGAQDAGLKLGYYHYFHPQDSVAEQVKAFTDSVGKAEPGCLRLFIDAEDASLWQPYTVDQRVKMVDEFLQGVKEKTGITPQVCIYCSPNFANEILGNSPVLSKYSLFIANYGVDKPTIPEPWGKWDFWQYTSSGKVPGINGRVDLDVFNGTDLSQDKVKSTNLK